MCKNSYYQSNCSDYQLNINLENSKINVLKELVIGGFNEYYNFVKSNFPEILDDVKTLFYNREYPSNKYQNNLYRKVVMICKKQGINTAMI